jgi:hypothetical protein
MITINFNVQLKLVLNAVKIDSKPYHIYHRVDCTLCDSILVQHGWMGSRMDMPIHRIES